MENKHRNEQEESRQQGRQDMPSTQSGQSADRGGNPNHQQGASRPGSPYKGRPARQGNSSRGSARREREDML